MTVVISRNGYSSILSHIFNLLEKNKERTNSPTCFLKHPTAVWGLWGWAFFAWTYFSKIKFEIFEKKRVARMSVLQWVMYENMFLHGEHRPNPHHTESLSSGTKAQELDTIDLLQKESWHLLCEQRNKKQSVLTCSIVMATSSMHPL